MKIFPTTIDFEKEKVSFLKKYNDNQLHNQIQHKKSSSYRRKLMDKYGKRNVNLSL